MKRTNYHLRAASLLLNRSPSVVTGNLKRLTRKQKKAVTALLKGPSVRSRQRRGKTRKSVRT